MAEQHIAITIPPKISLLQGYGIPLFFKQGTENPQNGYIACQNGRNIVKWLFSEANFSFSMFDFSLIKSLLWRQDQKIYVQFASGLQEVLDNCYYHLNSDEYNEHFIKTKELQIQAIINTALAIIPFTEPKDGAIFTIPQKINGQWVKQDYRVEKIQLTPDCFHDPYFAYGLKPINNPDAQAQLLFMGTNLIPTATGSHHTIMSDCMPAHSVGEHLYLAGKKSLDKWIQDNATPTKPIVSTGQSLGGSLAVISHIYQPDLVQARAINPPSWLSTLKLTYKASTARLAAKGKTMATDPIVIYTQKGDPVFQIGDWIPENSKLYLINSKTGTNASFLAKHKDCFAAHSAKSDLCFIELDPKCENTRIARKILTVFWQIISVPIAAFNIFIMLIKAAIYLISKLVTTICSLVLNKFANAALEKESACKASKSNLQP